jgi:hypothetical protein
MTWLLNLRNPQMKNKPDLRHPLLRGILQDLAPEFGCTADALKLRYFRGNTAVVSRVAEEAQRRIDAAKQVEATSRRIMEALAA